MYIGDYLGRRGIYSPDKLAIIDAGKEPELRLTYREWNECVNRLANWLKDVAGIGKGDRAAILARRRLNVAVDQTVQSLRGTTNPAGRKKLISTLRNLLAEQFGHDQVFLEYRLNHLSRELEELRAELATRRRNRAKIIGAWVGKLLAPPLAAEPGRAAVTADAR